MRDFPHFEAPPLPNKMRFEGGFYALISRLPSGKKELDLFTPSKERIHHKDLLPTDTEVFLRTWCNSIIKGWIDMKIKNRALH